MSEPVDLSDETIQKLADEISKRLAPHQQIGYPIYIHPPFWNPGYHYPYVTSQPNSGSVSGSSYGTTYNSAMRERGVH